MGVGLRELKQNLSEYLHRAERGEVIRVTERGVPMAQLVPLPGVGRLHQGIRAPQRPGPPQPFTRVQAESRVLDVLEYDSGTCHRRRLQRADQAVCRRAGL